MGKIITIKNEKVNFLIVKIFDLKEDKCIIKLPWYFLFNG